MANDRQTTAEIPALNTPTSVATLGPDWDTEDAYWQSAYPERATQWQGREWGDAERDLSDAWPTISDVTALTWDEIREAVRDAWDRVRGKSQDDRTHIR